MNKEIADMTPEYWEKFEQCFNQWPEPELIEDDIPRVQPFELRYLPTSFRDLVADIAERMQVPPDFPATIAVLALAGVVNRRARMQPKASDTSWTVVQICGAVSSRRLVCSNHQSFRLSHIPCDRYRNHGAGSGVRQSPSICA